MFIDIVDYTKTTTHLDRNSFNNLHDTFDSICYSLFKKHEGKIIKKIGDAFLVTFKSATEAVLCGVSLQNSFQMYNKQHKKQNPINVRVALHSGEVLHRNGDIYGDVVNTAARVESITKANHVVFSETVYTAMNKNEIDSMYLGPKKLKGLKSPLKLFRIKTKKDKRIQGIKKIKKKINKIKNTLFRFTFMILLVFMIYLGLKSYWNNI